MTGRAGAPSAGGSGAPLSGLRVLDLTRLLPGPVCTLHLADLGADVIKVEDPGAGDYARTLGARPGEVSAFYRMINRNKRSVVLDLREASGREALLGLVEGADALVESFRPGVMARLGLSYETLSARNPALVVCAISGYGQDGPFAALAGHDINYLGYAGVLDQIGVAGGPPALSNLQIADLLGGALTAAMGILAALLDARRSGRGRFVDVSMTDASLAHNIFALHALQQQGRPPERGREMLTGGLACYGVYATSDGRHMAVGALEEKFWAKCCEVLGRPDLVPLQFARGKDGARVRAELAAIFAGATQAQWVERFAGADCCVSPVLDVAEAVDHPLFRERGMLVRDAAGTLQYAPPLRMSGHAFAIRREAPAQGEHTREVLSEAGLAPDDAG